MAKISSRNTKAEILAAFEELSKEKRAIEAQIEQSNGSKQNSPQEIVKQVSEQNKNKSQVQQSIECIPMLQILS